MSKIVYALYDVQEMNLTQFSAASGILAKDAVSAYLTEKIFPNIGISDEASKDLLTDISNSKDIPELISCLGKYDFQLALMPVNNL